MTDRLAAERACKDPNPIIDGRKANVNLAYLGAKPRSLQTGEQGWCGHTWNLERISSWFLLIQFSLSNLVTLHETFNNSMLNESCAVLKWQPLIFLVLYRPIHWCAANSSSTYPKAIWVCQMSVLLHLVWCCSKHASSVLQSPLTVMPHIKETEQVPCALCHDWSCLLSGSKIVNFTASSWLLLLQVLYLWQRSIEGGQWDCSIYIMESFLNMLQFCGCHLCISVFWLTVHVFFGYSCMLEV